MDNLLLRCGQVRAHESTPPYPPYSGGRNSPANKRKAKQPEQPKPTKTESLSQYDSIRILQNKLKVYGMNLDEAINDPAYH